MQSIITITMFIGLLASPALGSAGIKGASYASKGAPVKGHAAPVEYSSPAAKGRLAVAQHAVPVPVAVPVQAAPVLISQVARNQPEPSAISVENRDWLVKQEQILQQQHESLETVQRDLKQSEEQHRIEQNKQIDEQNLLEPSATISKDYVRPARFNYEQATKGGQQIKQEKEEQQKLDPIIEQQREEQQKLDEVVYQKQEGAEAEPFSFAYNIEGQSRGESGDKNGVVRGYYRIASGDGQDRFVEYIADAQGFRAVVKTNEFGTEARSPAHVALHSSQPLAESITRSIVHVEQQKQRLAPLPSISQSPIQVLSHEHAPIPVPVQPRPVVHQSPAPVAPVVVLAQAPPAQTSQVREESSKGLERSEHSTQQQQQQESEDQVQLIKSSGSERGGKSLEVVRQSPPSSVERTFSSATAHRPVVQASPASHRAAKAEAAPLRAPIPSSNYNSGDDSHNAGFEHPLDN